jgi:hypothetical protein
MAVCHPALMTDHPLSLLATQTIMLTSGQWEIAMPSKMAPALSVALISLILVSAACQPPIKRTREVENDSSSLLGGLIQETDLSGEWRWIRESTFQHAKAPTPQNQQMLESAMRILSGDFGVENYYFTIVHGLERYPQNPPNPQVAEFQSALGLTNTKTLSLNLAPRGEPSAAKCWGSSNPDGETVCNIVTSYPYLLSNVVVYAPAAINDDSLREVLNQVLNQSDQRIKAIAH